MAFGTLVQRLLRVAAAVPYSLTLPAADAAGALTSDGAGTLSWTGPPGLISMYGGTAAPTGWLLCDGSSVLRATYAALFAVIGTTFGSVDGTHFTLPDLRQRFPLGKAASGTGATLGGTGGLIDHVHTGPSHTHTFTTGIESATQGVTGGGTGAAANNHTHSGTTAASGTGDTGVANPPFQVVNYIIHQ